MQNSMKTETIVSFPNLAFFDISVNNGSLDKAGPSARMGGKRWVLSKFQRARVAEG